MRSRLEGRFARYLDNLGLEWTYEPRAYGSPAGDYLPDFEVAHNGRSVFVEVKPTIGDLDTVEKALERLTVIWASIPSAILVLAFGDTPTVLVAQGDHGRWEITDWGEWWSLDSDAAA